MAFDPVCNMQVDPDNAQWVSEHKGTKYYFCDEGCKEVFDRAPDMWVKGGYSTSAGGGCSCCGGH